MIQRGICRPSKSPWASPLHLDLMKKKYRPRGDDFQRLNSVTIPNEYSVPHLHDVQWKLRGKKIFSTRDLEKTYHQIRIAPADIEKVQ